MMVGIDTSVILRLLVGEPVEQAELAREFLDRLFIENDRACVSDLVVSETYYALQYHYKVPKKEALDSLKALFESGEVVPSEHAAEILETERLATASPGFVDRLIHANYRSHCGEMATFEKKGSRLEGVRVLR